MQVGKHTHIEASDQAVRIVFGPERGLWDRVSRFLWAALFSFPLCGLLGAIAMAPLRGSGEIVLACVFGALGASFLVRIILDLLWTLFGWEEILLDEHTLTMTVRLFAYRRTESFAVGDISELRYDGQLKERFGFRRPRVAFEYQGRTVGTSSRITRQEVHAAVRHLRAKLARDNA
jgi:hypothetical protein